MVTFGIKPTRSESGYGYLELSKDTLDRHGSSNLQRFVEKPSVDIAAQMLAGNFLWNLGIFLFRAQDMIDAFTVHKPKTLDLVSKSFANASTDLGFLRLSADPWSMLEDISIDYAIMEKVQNLVAVPYASKWSDLGGWDAVWFESAPDRSGNAISQNAHAIECSNSLLRSESKSQQLVGIGLDNIIAVSMPDAVLVADKQRAQDVKKVVELLKSKDVMQAEVFPKDHRPWAGLKAWFWEIASRLNVYT